MSWQPTPTLTRTVDDTGTRFTYTVPKPVDLSTLIACITCRATVTQSCRVVAGKSKGRRKADHTLRLVKRLCTCGSTLEHGHQLCGPCAREALRESKRLYMQRQRGGAA